MSGKGIKAPGVVLGIWAGHQPAAGVDVNCEGCGRSRRVATLGELPVERALSLMQEFLERHRDCIPRRCLGEIDHRCHAAVLECRCAICATKDPLEYDRFRTCRRHRAAATARHLQWTKGVDAAWVPIAGLPAAWTGGKKP